MIACPTRGGWAGRTAGGMARGGGAESAAPLWERICEQLIHIAVAGLWWRGTVTVGAAAGQP